jgi:predicted SprT family Zn-dependent metalloprotease
MTSREDYTDEEWRDICETYADPGSNSALRAATKSNPRNLSCPNCKQRNKLTPADRDRAYVCDTCADLAERGGY